MHAYVDSFRKAGPAGVEDVVSSADAIAILQANACNRAARESLLHSGYSGYDTSVGWMAYDNEKIREMMDKAISQGFHAFKLKVGSKDEQRDLRRAAMLRERVGDDGIVMFDANQREPAGCNSYGPRVGEIQTTMVGRAHASGYIHAHVVVARELAPVKIATGEHIPNRVLFKNFMQCRAMHFVQADCTRLAGISEFLTVSLLAKKFGLPILPHVGDTGQIHQHLVFFNHIAMGHDVLFLEYIPHLREHFAFPAKVNDGSYQTPSELGASCDLKM